ncbi:MAG TPA: hypothetical protein VHE99_05500 [Gammaproteobacteria bacterium]|nr:hypothetical protein [Gammaproteobacteria bacterium]
MGVNQHGLTIIEEDSPLPPNANKNRRFQQPENGTAEGMIKYGILQNFNTVDEILPFYLKYLVLPILIFTRLLMAKRY